MAVGIGEPDGEQVAAQPGFFVVFVSESMMEGSKVIAAEDVAPRQAEADMTGPHFCNAPFTSSSTVASSPSAFIALMTVFSASAVL